MVLVQRTAEIVDHCQLAARRCPGMPLWVIMLFSVPVRLPSALGPLSPAM